MKFCSQAFMVAYQLSGKEPIKAEPSCTEPGHVEEVVGSREGSGQTALAVNQKANDLYFLIVKKQ